MKKTLFSETNLIEPIRRAVREQGFNTPTPIQEQAIPLLLEGNDLMGSAQTGSGKTAAFTLPILQNLATNRIKSRARTTRVLVLVPTRELAVQISECFATFGKYLRLKQALVYGGVSRSRQIERLARGVDIVVATPGRLLDLMQEGAVLLHRTEVFVLDEADRMLDMGFIPDIKKILAKLPARRQSMFFSATLPPDAVRLAESMLKEPNRIEIVSNMKTEPKIEQNLLFVERENKKSLLMEIVSRPNVSKTLVFTRTKHKAQNLARQLVRKHLKADSLHGDKSQTARQKALRGFHSGSVSILVATDIAARGIDVSDIDHVINFDLPNEPEIYVHRIGRTARAGKIGTALSFCDRTEMEHLYQIERFLKNTLPVLEDHPFHSKVVAASKKRTTRPTGASRSSRPSSRSRRPHHVGGRSYSRTVPMTARDTNR